MRDLSVTLIQCELAWEQPADNRQQIGDIIAGSPLYPPIEGLPDERTRSELLRYWNATLETVAGPR